MRALFELDVYPVTLPGIERLGVLVAVAVGEVQDPVADAHGRPVRSDLVQPERQEGDRLVHGDVQADGWRTENLKGLFERAGVEAERIGVICPLVSRELNGIGD